MTPGHLPPRLRQAYEAVSPDGPAHYYVVADKLVALWRKDLAMSPSDFAALEMPVLVMLGDDDMQSVENAVALQRAMRDARLAVIPGTDHLLLAEKPELANRILLDFLAREQVPKLMAM